MAAPKIKRLISSFGQGVTLPWTPVYPGLALPQELGFWVAYEDLGSPAHGHAGRQHFPNLWRGWWDKYLLAYEAKPKLTARNVSVLRHVVQPEL